MPLGLGRQLQSFQQASTTVAYVANFSDEAMNQLEQLQESQASPSWVVFELNPSFEMTVPVPDAKANSPSFLNAIADGLASFNTSHSNPPKTYSLATSTSSGFLIQGSNQGSPLPTIFAPDSLGIHAVVSIVGDNSTGPAPTADPTSTVNFIGVVFANVTLWAPHISNASSVATLSANGAWTMVGKAQTCFANSTVVFGNCSAFPSDTEYLCFSSSGFVAMSTLGGWYSDQYGLDVNALRPIECISLADAASPSGSPSWASTSDGEAVISVLCAVVLLVAVAVGICILCRRRRALKTAARPRSDPKSDPAGNMPAKTGFEEFASNTTHTSTDARSSSAFASNVARAADEPSRVTLRTPTLSRSLDYGATISDFTSPKDALIMQLNALAAKRVALCDRYEFGDSSERRVGGQGVVQFATHSLNGRQYAIKFYLNRAAFQVEAEHFANVTLRPVLPAVQDILDNSSFHVLGRPLPPCVIMERGESLDEWQRRSQSDFVTAMQIVMHLAQRVVAVHEAGIVHRDLKPANAILNPGRNEWTLIDFGCGARIGSTANVALSWLYAAPETVEAVARGETTVVADPAVDVWALAVIAWELLTRTRVFSSPQQVTACMTGSCEPLPWERLDSSATTAQIRRLGFMADGILRMLARDPAERATLPGVLRSWRSNLQHDTTASMHVREEEPSSSSLLTNLTHSA